MAQPIAGSLVREQEPVPPDRALLPAGSTPYAMEPVPARITIPALSEAPATSAMAASFTTRAVSR